MDDCSHYAGATEKIMRRVLDNMLHLSQCEALYGASGWQQVIIEPGPASEDAAFCLVVDPSARQRATHTG